VAARIERLRAGEGERWRDIRLSALEQAPYAFGTTYAEAAQWAADRWEAQVVELATFVAVVDGRDVGVARGAAHPSGDVGELISMWVDPSARRQGVGAQLIDSVAAWAKIAGAKTLMLDVVADNAEAIALYERAGFRRCDDQVRGECPPGEIRLARSLSCSRADPRASTATSSL
jgi:GNAT superfamily N-acetyltransferase